MSGTQAAPTVIPFGPFEADLPAQELRKHGVRLRLPGQSFQILKMLLEKPGELVTREEMRAALWPADTFVDFEHGLNAAVNRLREALGDDADSPRYIETLPRRGYQFVAPLKQPVPIEVTVSVAEEKQSNVAATRRGFRGWAIGFSVVAALTLAAVCLYWIRSSARPPRVLAYRRQAQACCLATLWEKQDWNIRVEFEVWVAKVM